MKWMTVDQKDQCQMIIYNDKFFSVISVSSVVKKPRAALKKRSEQFVNFVMPEIH
jgi:hypothetical protein